MAKYGKKTSDMVKKTIRKMKKHKLKSGKSKKTVKSRIQAIAIALSEAREKGLKVPKRKKAKSKK
jgi:uncharacterized protein (DUF2235 family)